MARFIRGAISLILVLAPLASATPADEGELAPGREFLVERQSEVSGQFAVAGGQRFPMEYEREVRWREKLTQVKSGAPSALERLVERAAARQTDPLTGQETRTELARPGQRFRVELGRSSRKLFDAETDRRIRDEELEEAFAIPTPLAFVPEGSLEVGRAWSFEGQEVSRRFAMVSADGGKASLEVVRIDGVEAAARAVIVGDLVTEIPFEPIALEFRATIALEVPLASRWPDSCVIEGRLSGSGTIPGDFGQAIPLSFEGTGRSSLRYRPLAAAPEQRGDERAPGESDEKPAPPTPGRQPVILRRVAEPREGAFTMMIPADWSLEGGIVRIDPTAAGGPAQSMEAKVDVTVQDSRGRVRLRRVADWYFVDVRNMPAAQLGMFQQGSNYQGMTVWPTQSATGYLLEILFPNEHQGASGVKVVERRSLPEISAACRKRMGEMLLALRFDVDAGVVRVNYEEEGAAYEEVLFTLIEDRGPLAGGQWANRETFTFRAPLGELEQHKALFDTMLSSVVPNPKWFKDELKNQLIRQGIWEKVRGQLDDIDKEIVEHRRRTNAEIHNDVFLTLTEQEEYVNPYSGEIEIGTDQLGRHRWQNESGDVVYSDREGFDPNTSGTLNRSDWKRSKIRPRFGE